jgi:hypothetical protein
MTVAMLPFAGDDSLFCIWAKFILITAAESYIFIVLFQAPPVFLRKQEGARGITG